ncbi:MAG: Smr/MutS family protein [Opitutaceae bacterium]|jgi:DNA-nicking Smr family endonuclease|nr:Smr/MutS family protein [Opitutaceae bacterium]
MKNQNKLARAGDPPVSGAGRARVGGGDAAALDSGGPVVIPINGELDLHTFAPRETARVLDAYVEACLGRGIHSLRVIHGKGTGALRETVRAWLRRDARVESFRPGDETSGGWGATIARLRTPPPPARSPAG